MKKDFICGNQDFSMKDRCNEQCKECKHRGNNGTLNNYPSSEFEQKDKCPTCGSYCNIHTDLDENDECNDCRESMNFHECSECNIRCNCTTAECSCSCKDEL